MREIPVPKETLWEFDQHTIAKHKILGGYLKGWAPILTTQGHNGRIVYIDGFAGPGEDSHHELNGSPLIAIDSVVNHTLASHFKSEIVMHFIEQRKDRADYLRELISRRFPTMPGFLKYAVDQADFLPSLEGILDNLESQGQRLAPTFCFVDPFGWKDLDLFQLARFMNEKKAELFITFMAGFVQRFEAEENHIPSLKRLFSEEQLFEAETKSPEEKGEFLLNSFVSNLKSKMQEMGITKPIYSIAFETRNSSNNLEYYLIYLTSHEKGMAVMKDAMNGVARNGEFIFSDFDFDPNQASLVNYGLEKEWPENAGEDLLNLVRKKGLLGTPIPILRVRSLVILESLHT